MQNLYRKVPYDDVQRIIDWCRNNSVRKNGIFEIYEDPAGINRVMIVVNSFPGHGSVETLHPLGAFYCNYLEPGTLSLEEDPDYDTAESRKKDTERVKRIINILLEQAGPGKLIDFKTIRV